jgi:hypothetical protein
MKKIYLTLSLALSIGSVFAQFNTTNVLKPNTPSTLIDLNQSSSAKVATTSTLMPTVFMAGGCAAGAAGVVYYSVFSAPQATTNFTVGTVGYAFGTNLQTYTLSAPLAAAVGSPTLTSDANRSAQKYNFTGTGFVTDIIVFTGIAEGTGVVSAKVYNENTTTKAPNVQLGGTVTKPLSAFTGNDIFTFASPIAISSGNFFVSIENTTIGGSGLDTLAILSSTVGCSTTDSLSWRYNTVSPTNPLLSSDWSNVKSDFGGNLDLAIFPVLDITTGVNNGISSGNLTLLAAFPNPATNDVSINFGLKQSSKVEIEIYDVTGKKVNTINLDELEAGNHSSKINTSNLSGGVYMYSVKSENSKMFSKFTIAK